MARGKSTSRPQNWEKKNPRGQVINGTQAPQGTEKEEINVASGMAEEKTPTKRVSARNMGRAEKAFRKVARPPKLR